MNIMETDLELAFALLSDPAAADETSGDVDSPTGHFALIIIGDGGDLDAARAYVARHNPHLDSSKLTVGNYVAVTDSAGFTDWTRFGTEEAARDACNDLETGYTDWFYSLTSE